MQHPQVFFAHSRKYPSAYKFQAIADLLHPGFLFSLPALGRNRRPEIEGQFLDNEHWPKWAQSYSPKFYKPLVSIQGAIEVLLSS